MSDIEAPEPDAHEQAQPLEDDEEVADEPHLGVDVPEADALEQAQTVPIEDEEGRE